MKEFRQPVRLFILIAYVALLFVACKIALGSWIPPFSDKGIWFYSGLAALLLGDLIVTPFYTKPVDAISYSVPAIIVLLGTSPSIASGVPAFDRYLWLVATMYVAAVLVSGLVSIALKDSRRVFAQRFSRSLYDFCDIAGKPRAVFSAVFLFALIVFHRDIAHEYLTISIAWFLVIGLNPLGNFAHLAKRWSATWGTKIPVQLVGEVIAHQTPGIALIRQTREHAISYGQLLVIPSSEGVPTLGLAADHIGWAEGRWLRVIQVRLPEDTRTALSILMRSATYHQGAFLLPDMAQLPTTLQNAVAKHPLLERRQRLLGIVAPNTDISILRFEIVRTDLDLEEGRLIEVQLGKNVVLYQIVNGITKEEIIQQKNIHGYVRGEAKKIGRWNAGRKGFDVVKWVPLPNEPVFLVEAADYFPSREAVGHFPGTDYPVQLVVDQLVTHNTAILGILGAGKSFLALELVERMIAEEIKVVCLDLTNQYADKLRPHYNKEEESTKLERLKQVGPPGKTNFQSNREEGGSVVQFREAIQRDLREFLVSHNFVKIYNPVALEVWRQDGWLQRDGSAAMASLTPTEITRIVTEVLLELLQGEMTERARACIVFEEAHSIIPEWTAVAYDGDKAATNGTAKAILQGRKFGLGCLLITQRTANVTKSILNQCNTVFALRVFDATGMEFLKNYIGEDYAAILSTLEDRHAVVFGRASSCRNPVLVRLNEREDFIRVFRRRPEDMASAEETA